MDGLGAPGEGALAPVAVGLGDHDGAGTGQAAKATWNRPIGPAP